MTKIEGIIFDLDDTLYNEIDYVKSGYMEVAKYLATLVDIAEVEIYELLFKRFLVDRKNVINHVLNVIGICEDHVLEQSVQTYRNHKPNIKLSDEVASLLAELKKSYKLGLITDGRPEGQWAKIDALGLNDIFDKIIVTDELGGIQYRKPNPLSFINMSKILGIDFEKLVYIGDNERKDFITAKRLGMVTIKVINKKGLYLVSTESVEYKAHLEVNTLLDLSFILSNLNDGRVIQKIYKFELHDGYRYKLD